jgi:hypothetical protein
MKLLLVAVGASAVYADTTISIPLDAQINTGVTDVNVDSPNGDALYVPPWDPNTHHSFTSEAGDDFSRLNFDGNQWYYFYIDFVLAGYDVDISPGGSFTVDIRYYQDLVTNTNPYADAPVFCRFYTYVLNAQNEYEYQGYRGWDFIYATNDFQGIDCIDAPYPTWTNCGIPDIKDLTYSTTCDGVERGSEGGTFDETQITRFRFYGTDWEGNGDDFVDLMNYELTITGDCPPDWNGDTVLNSQDFIAFLNDFVAGNADYDGDTVTNSQDFIAFLNDFVAGC